jgi:hypothetical protein
MWLMNLLSFISSDYFCCIFYILHICISLYLVKLWWFIENKRYIEDFNFLCKRSRILIWFLISELNHGLSVLRILTTLVGMYNSSSNIINVIHEPTGINQNTGNGTLLDPVLISTDCNVTKSPTKQFLSFLKISSW